MRISIDGLQVLFPYDYIYPEQYQYMQELKRTLDAPGHGLLEMPSGTGKTATILSFLLAYHASFPEKSRQIVYCTRTVPEIDKALIELKRIVDYRSSVDRQEKNSILGVGLSSRKNLCINPSVNYGGSSRAVDGRCHNLTASWMRRKANDPQELCRFFEEIESVGVNNLQLPNGVYSLEELKEHGRLNKVCPYFLARSVLTHADVVIYSYYYLLDPKVAELVSSHIRKNAVIVFDEAHNIDNVCIESLSIDLTRHSVEAASRSLIRLQGKVQELKERDSEKLKAEYEALLQGLKKAQSDRLSDRIMASPVLADDLLMNSSNHDDALVPGNIRQAEHFVAFMRRFVEFLRARFKKTLHVVSESPAAFLQAVKEQTLIERKPMRYCSERLASLLKTLELSLEDDDLGAVSRVAYFATLVSTYMTGFTVLFEPFDDFGSSNSGAVLSLACLDATIVLKGVFARFRNVIITSGTLSPLDMYPRLLDFTPVVQVSLPMTMVRDSISPLIITRGSDQVAVSSRFEIRNDPAVVRNYGQILLDFCRIVPDGLVAFFPSYIYLESIVVMWQEMGIIEQILKLRLLFIETPDGAETAMALDNYRRACDCGRGAVLLSVARGKVSEGIDFERHYGRAVILFGIPYQYTESRILKSRLEYLREAYGIRETDFLTFDALRHAAQCLGRVLRGKTDYGLMVLADRRYSRQEKRGKLPKWIAQSISDGHCNLSADQAIVIGKKFFKDMARPVDMRDQLGFALLDENDVKKLNENEIVTNTVGYIA